MSTKKEKTPVEKILLEKIEELEKENSQLRNKPDNYSIALDEYIEVMSLVPYRLNLSTEKLGRGRSFSFSQFGEVKRILYNDLASILENYRSFMEQGLFYILDQRVIRKHGLDDIYSKILDKDTLLKIVKCDTNSVIKLYDNASNVQKSVIDGMIIDELKKDNHELDLNVVSKISKIADIDLIKVAEDAKKLEAIPVTSN